MEEVSKTKRRTNRLHAMAIIADDICHDEGVCEKCPLYLGDATHCVLAQIEHKVDKYVVDTLSKPTYEELPIDIDDDYQCDSCGHPYQNDCFKKSDDDCPYGLGECCEDNLATNVGRICFDHNIPTNFAMAIIEIIQKERDRNEYLHIYREHIPAE